MKNAVAALLLGVSPLAIVQLAHAQPAPLDNAPQATSASDEDDGEDRNEIVVTGSFIRGIAPTGNQVLGVTEEDIKATGAKSTNEVLATIPQIGNFFNDLNVTGQTGNSPATINANSAAQVMRPNLRNLGGGNAVIAGSSATLILMDGHRMVGAGVDQSSPDAGVIPPGLLARVEIITDGGSAIYGSDAVGGVINFITRRKFDGIRVSGRYALGNDFSNPSVDVTAGQSWSTGSVFGAFSYSKDSPVFGYQRDFFRALNFNPFAPNDRYLTGEFRNCSAPNVTIGSTNYAVTSPTAIGAANSYNACDVGDYQTLAADQKTISLLAGLTQEITPGIELNVRGFYTHRNTLTYAGALTTSVRVEDEIPSATTGTSPYYIDVPGAAANGAQQTVLFSFAPYNGNLGARKETDLKTWGITADLNIDLGSDWKVSVLGNYGESDTFFRNADLNTARLQYYATGNGSPGATACAFNMVVGASGCNINPYNIAASNPTALNDILNRQSFGDAHQSLTNFRAVFDGPLFSLPGGEVRAAVGAEYIRQGIRQRRGLTNYGDEGTLTPLASSRDNKAFFAELNVPIFGADNRMPAFESLVLSGSVRHDRYSDFGNTTNPQVGLVWKVVPWLSFRGNWGTSFVAPSLQEVLAQNFQVVAVNNFSPNWSGYTIPADHTNLAGTAAFGSSTAPANGATQTLSITGASPNLQPQTGQSWSLGMDGYAPFAPSLRFALTYYNVSYENTLGSLRNFIAQPTQERYNFWNRYLFVNGTDGSGPNGAFTAADIQAFCAPSINPSDCSSVNPSAVYLLADLRSDNFGAQKAQGFDFSLRWNQPFSWGELNAGVAGNYLLSSSTKNAGETVFTDADLSLSSRYRLTVTAGVTVGDFAARATMRYSAGYNVIYNGGNLVTPTSAGPFQDHVDAFYPIDLFLRYNLGPLGFSKNVEATLNVTNIADADPPLLRQTGSYGYANGQTLGRTFILGLTADF